MTVPGDTEAKGSSFEIDAAPDSVHTLKVFVTVPKDRLPEGTAEFTIGVTYPVTGEQADHQANFNVPEK